MPRLKTIFLASLCLVNAKAALACQHCQPEVIRVCDENQKHPACHDVLRCTGGTCGDESVTTFRNVIFNDAAVSRTLMSRAPAP